MHVVFRNCTRNEVNVAIAPSRIRGQQLECEGKEADYPLKLLYLNSVHSRALLEHRDFGRSLGHFNQFNPIILFCLLEITTTIQPRSPLFCRSVDSWISQTRGHACKCCKAPHLLNFMLTSKLKYNRTILNIIENIIGFSCH